MYTRKRDFFCDGLERLGLKHNRPQGTYFVLLDISDFLALDQFKGWSDMEFCEWMIREIGGGGGARLQLLPGAGEPPDPPALRPQRGDPSGGPGPSGQAGGAVTVIF